MSYFKTFQINSDNPTGDAFGRVRMSMPETLFDSKQIFDNQPLFWDDAEVSGSGTSSSHSSDTASTTISVGATTAGNRTRQTFQRFNYQPGKSQLILITGVIDKSGGGSDITRSIGVFDDNNGLFFRDNAGTIQVVRRTFVTGSAVDNAVNQSSWNIDPMDGTGNSGITIDFTKTQIFVIDFEWLGVGRVRMGFNIDGVTYYCHEFLNANVLDEVYISTPNLPLRYEIENGGTGAASSMQCICSSVMSEGGIQDLGAVRYVSTDGTHVDANSANTIYACVGIRLKAVNLGATIRPVSISMISETNDDFEWMIILNPTVSGTFTYSDETNTSIQAARGATANTVTNGTKIAGGFASVDTLRASQDLENVLGLGSKIDGTVDELVLCVRPLSANADIQAGITYRETQ